MKTLWILLTVLIGVSVARAQETTASNAPMPVATLHPALFLVGDSIMKTGKAPGDIGPWGMGYEIIPMFDPGKIHVYNEALGGRSSRSYIEEGLWSNVLARTKPGDFILVMFGHNDSGNSVDHPDRTTISGNGEETISVGVGDKRKTLHTYGWYLRQYAKEGKAAGATVILCSPVPRNTWIDGKIKRGFDGYAQWAADAAKESGALFLDLNNLAADRYDALGQDRTTKFFSDHQHTTKAGARLNAECVIEGVRQLKDCPLAGSLRTE